MSAKKDVEALLEKWSVDELLDNQDIDLTPMIEFSLEGLGSTEEDDLDDYLDAMQEAMDELEIEEDDRLLIWNRCAMLMFANILPEGSFEGLGELYGGAEGSTLCMACMTYIDYMNERDEIDPQTVIRWHLFVRDLIRLSWKENGSADFATEMLWQTENACELLSELEKWDEIGKLAEDALDTAEEIEGDAEGLREVKGLLTYFRGEGEEDDDKAEGWYRKAIKLLDCPEITKDPVSDETLGVLDDLKEDWED